ncbi:Ribonuclease H-like superfamily [Arabidopsis thaliana x Arabidopsis arenosa]|uniref:Ribonuclease H-like superfamily n=1 Tax=Arabidopsis thaliana x Arabidopsis arenosa TaxID=1240361 RepID=A0A8T1ZJ72_9BRAS|nr:Ribonuclease H-like superfamily [Arabidopsis thaliana x Arabidopsis arenosa]
MGSNEQKSFDIPKFDDKGDFGLWKFKVKCQLELPGLEHTLKEPEAVSTLQQTSTSAAPEDGGKATTEVKTETERAKFDLDEDKRARTIICMSLGDKPLRKVMNELTALGVWRALERDYQSKSLPNRIYLKQRFSCFKFEENKSIEENLDIFLKLVDDFASLTINISNEDQAIQILSALPEPYESLRDTLRYGAGKTQSLTIDDVTNGAYSKEIELNQKMKSKANLEGLFVSRGRSENMDNDQGGNRSKSNDTRSKSRKRNQPKARECWVCWKEGHFKVDCPQKKSTNAANVAQEEEHPMILTESLQHKRCNTPVSGIWWCMRRVKRARAGAISGWVTFQKVIVGTVYTFHITPDKDALFDLKEIDGGKVLMGNNTHSEVKGIGKLKIQNPDGSIGTVLNGEAYVARAEVNLTNRWHSRLGHMSLKNMNILVKEGYLDSKEVHTLDFCEECVLGKSHKQSFPEAKHRHPRVWIRFLKSKEEVFEKFSEWKKLVENQTNKKIKYLRTDNGLEFCNQQMDKLCIDSGIKRHRTCTYTPQQNGVSERMNRTIADKIRCMLAETGMEKKFWAEAAATVVYLINRFPNASLKFKIPEEVWSGSKVDNSYLRRFGCVAYVHVQQDKMSPRAVKGIFMGYPLGTKGYKKYLKLRRRKSGNTSSNGLDGTDSEETESTGQGGANSEGTESGTETNEETESEEDGESSPEQESQEEQHESLDDYMLARDRDRRVIKPPTRIDGSHYVAYALTCGEDLEIDEPRSVGEARRTKYWKKWEQAMIEEMRSLEKNETWEIVSKPDKKKIVGFVVNFDLELEQLDVMTAFLHGTLDEVIYMNQPEGFIEKGREDEVCLLKKSLYGLKQSPRQWNQKFDEFMKSQGFHRSVNDPCVYHKGSTIDDKIFLLLYVDDMLVAAKDLEKIKVLKKSLNKEFEMMDLGPAIRILGMDIIRNMKKGVLKLSQGRYLKQVLRTFNMDDCKAVVSPINSAMKLRSLTREELNTLCKFMSKPGRDHWAAVKWILRYLKGATEVGGNTVSWRSSLQHVVALSTIEAEYMALTEAAKEAKNSVHHDRTKHIATKVHFSRDLVNDGSVNIAKIHTTLNPADMLTKGLPGNAFEKCLVTLKVIT